MTMKKHGFLTLEMVWDEDCLSTGHAETVKSKKDIAPEITE